VLFGGKDVRSVMSLGGSGRVRIRRGSGVLKGC
jgi:hypothetical protein